MTEYWAVHLQITVRSLAAKYLRAGVLFVTITSLDGPWGILEGKL